ncbi:MAG: cation diffusion facilitator family transporter [Bacteroidota bacterium]
MFATWWAGIFAAATRGIQDGADVRQTAGVLEAWVSIIGNILLFAIKFAIGTVIHSISLIADSFHTLSDVLTSIVVLAGFKISRRAPDDEHPFGHGRGESIATLVIALLLVLVGAEFLIQSVRRLLHPAPVAGTPLVVGVMVLSGIAKELMASFSSWLGKRIESSALVADAWHHRSDAVASVLVAVAIVGAIFRVYWLDGLFGVGVSFLIAYTGIDLGRSSINDLLGRSPSLETLKTIQDEAAAVDGVVGVHDVNVHDYGQRLAVSLHVEVEPNLDVTRAHFIADEVEKRIIEKMKADAVVHVDPREGRL